jgi:ABC-type transporter Mla subunit MlaD
MPVENLYEQLNDALQEFKSFLDKLVATDEFDILKTVLETLQGFVPQITQMIDKVIELLQDLKAGIAEIDLGNIPDLDTATKLSANITATLAAASPFLPGRHSEITTVVNTANVIASIPGLTEELRNKIIACIDVIIDRMTKLKP